MQKTGLKPHLKPPHPSISLLNTFTTSPISEVQMPTGFTQIAVHWIVWWKEP